MVSFDGSATFSDDNTGAIYSWNFGDGFTDLGESVAHTFNSLGLYTVTFTATDINPTGCSSSDSIQVQVLSPYIDVDQTTYTVPELVEDVLINSACASVSNITGVQGPILETLMVLGILQLFLVHLLLRQVLF